MDIERKSEEEGGGGRKEDGGRCAKVYQTDPVIIMCVSGRQVSTIAKSTLFTMPVLGQILRALKAVPVMRRQDFKGATQDNSPALDAMAQ